MDIQKDCQNLLNFIQKMKLHKSTNRNTLTPRGNAPISDIYGLTKFSQYSNGRKRKPSQYPGWYDTKLKTDYPQFQELLELFSSNYLPPDFTWTSVVINKNFQCKKHIDSQNIGESYIVGLGDYSGGDTAVQNANGSVTFHNIKNNPVGFNGSKLYHWTEAFQGDRYSLVFYSNL